MDFDTYDQMFGSSVAALLARVGSGAPWIDEDGSLRHGGQEIDRRILARYKDTDRLRRCLRGYINATTGSGRDDQEFVLSLVERRISRLAAGIYDPPDDRLMFVMGGGGVGKTEVLAQSVKMALDAKVGNIVVVAPTNRAVKVLSARIRKFVGESPYLRIGTCHSVFKKLALNAVGEAVVRHFVEGREGRVTDPYADPSTLDEVNDVYELFVGNPKAVKKALAVAASLKDMPDQSHGHQAILRHMGFAALDYRVTCWMNAVCEAAVVFLDEVSMVAKGIATEALESGSLVFAFGDAAQLEPVSLTYTDPSGMVISDKPAISLANDGNSVYLWQSRRTEYDSNIRKLADTALRARNLSDFAEEAKRLARDPDVVDIVACHGIREVPREDLERGVALTYTNATRHSWNNAIRTFTFLRPDDRLVSGDKFFVSGVNQANRGDLQLVKDEFLTLIRVGTTPGEHEWAEYTFADELGREVKSSDISLHEDRRLPAADIEYMRSVTASPGVSFADTPYCANPNSLLLGFANCLTIHKSQGSEWPVVVFDLKGMLRFSFLQQEDDETPGLGGVAWKRWRRLVYTAVSRARSKLIIIV